MNFDLTEDQQMFADTAKQFSDSELLPNSANWDQEHVFPKDVITKAGELGFCALYTPEDAGGLNLSRLDTLADVFINDELVLRSSNMFQLHRIDITPFAVLGENRISIHLHRVDEEAKKRAETLPMPIPWAIGNNQIPHMNLIRKTQCHSGWDWGICLLVSGVYDPITIDVINSIALHSVCTEQIWHQGSVDVVVSIRHEPIAEQQLTITFAEQTQTLLSNSSGESSTIFHIEDPIFKRPFTPFSSLVAWDISTVSPLLSNAPL